VPVFVSTSSFKDCRKATSVVDAFLAAGIKNIELGSSHAYETGLLEAIKIRPANYTAHNYFPAPQTDFVLNLGSLDRTILNESRSFIKSAIDFCAAAGIGFYSFHPGFLVDPGQSAPGSEGNYDFDFSNKQLSNYDESFATFVASVKEIVAYAALRRLKIACENAGSVSKNKYLMMTKSAEFIRLFSEVNREDFGLLLDLGHLNLAARANAFDKDEFIERLAPRIRCFHIHDNNGVDDEHKSLSEDSWTLKVISRPEFCHLPVVFEGRELSVEEIVGNKELIERLLKRGAQ
jgi:sugar phosphate isomerase/epimerase